MNLALLPKFGGELHEPWDLHEVQLLSWFRIHQIPEHDDQIRVDFLILSLKPNSSPLNWFIHQPSDLKASFSQSLNLLQSKYGTDLRKEMHRISAMNCLEVRSFRDNEHKTEMVFELINELEQLLTCGSVNQDAQRRDYLLRCFRGFSGALKMMNRTTSYDSAVLAALNWEASVISKAEEAMIQAGLKRQLAQKLEKAQARTRRTSNSNPPVNDHQPAGFTSEFMAQDLNPDPVRLHPDVYYKTHLPPSDQLRHKKSSHETMPIPLPQSQNGFQTSASAAPHGSSGTKADTDPSQIMESLVDPHLLARQSPRRLQKFYQLGGYPNPEGINQSSQEVLDHSSHHAQNVKIKPLVYDPQKNPYPPPEQLAENKPHNRLEPSPSFRLPHHPLDKHVQEFPTPNIPNSERPKRNPLSRNHSANLSQTGGIPFPSPHVPSQPLQGPSSARRSPVPIMASGTQQSTYALPGSSSQRGGTPIFDSASNIQSTSGSIQNQFLASSQHEHESNLLNLKRRPSKLVKLRRKGSTSTNNSSSSTRSFQHVRSFIGSINKRAGRSSQSGDESDSTQDHGPITPSSLEPGGGGSGSGFDSEGNNERLRPMQAQFYRLFRKHNHPEHLRRQNRAMFISKPVRTTKSPDKGKARAPDDVHLVDDRFSQRHQPISTPRSLKSTR